MVHRHERGEQVSFSVSSKKRALPGRFSSERAARYAIQFCEHQLEMLEATINRGEKRLITSVDLRVYARLCHDCSMAKARAAVLGEKQ